MFNRWAGHETSFTPPLELIVADLRSLTVGGGKQFCL
jgi:hypothetical protein